MKPYKLLYEGVNQINVENLMQIYRDSPKKARVIWSLNKDKYSYFRIVLFEGEKEGDFDIVEFIKTFGISVTNKIYSSEKTEVSFMRRGNNFYFTRYGRIKNATLSDIPNFSDYQTVKKILCDRLFWFRTVDETGTPQSFNRIVKKKLFTPSKLNADFWGLPKNVYKVFQDFSFFGTKRDLLRVSKEIQKVLINITSLTKEQLNHWQFMDTCKMAAALGEKVNCKWGAIRLKNEHDRMTKEVQAIQLEFTKLEKLNVKDVFKELAGFSGYKLAETNHDLIAEGLAKQHCVGSYSQNVNSGQCAIFMVGDYTLQVSPYMDIVQFRGLKNAPAPESLYSEVKKVLEQFKKVKEIKTETTKINDDYPF